jgi:RimJ/RimL family protein N-acetyltransferase
VLLRDWAHATLGLTAVELLAHRDNHGSQRVAERAGFADTGAVRTVRTMPPGRREGHKAYAWRAPGEHPPGR